jgi:ADP-heptose:LPS heptosyltransferase
LQKKCLVIRYGAFGDHIIASPIYRLLKKDGYHITVNTTKTGMMMLKCNPFIDKFLEHKTMPADENLTKHWEEISQGYDKVINLSESIEGSLLKIKSRPDFNQSKEELFKECNVNYYDRTAEVAGYPDAKGMRGELYFSRFESKVAKRFEKKYRSYFKILWPLSGSTSHKAYPFAENVAMSLLTNHQDIMIFITGDMACEILAWQHPRTKNYIGRAIRHNMALIPYMDLVIGNDTGMLHAAGCFDVPKILLLSSITKETLSKYWTNAVELSAGVECQPCFKLHYDKDMERDSDGYVLSHTCTVNRIGWAKCMAKLKKETVYAEIKKVHNKWREKRYGIFHQQSFRETNNSAVCG